MPRPDGGPAFPVPLTLRLDPKELQNGEPMRVVVEGDGGMSLRDWFAGQALAGMLANGDRNEAISTVSLQREIDVQDLYAQMAYETADAMLKEREK